jgi:GT2 family glycosyltransferase
MSRGRERPTVSVVIPNLNGRDLLGLCLERLREQTVTDAETIVVDNGSEDDSLAFVERSFPETRIVALGENRGFAGGMNAGIENARGAYVASLNNDAEPAPSWLEELLACLDRHPRAAAATAKLVSSDGPGRLDGAGDGLTPSFLPFVRGHGQPDDGLYGEEVEVFGASGTASLWRAEVLHELGGFDERFFAYYEDVDLSFRARLAGWELWYAPLAVAAHRRGATARADIRFTLHNPARNRWFFLVKDAPATLLLRHPLGLLAGEGFWWRRALRAHSPATLLRAYGEVLGELQPLLRERRKLQAGRAVSPRALDRMLSRPG